MFLLNKIEVYLILIIITLCFSNIDNSVVASTFMDIKTTTGTILNRKIRSHNIFENTQFARSHRERKRNKRRSRSNEKSNEIMSPGKPCTQCTTIDGFVPMSKISDAVRIMVGKSRIVGKSNAVEIQRSRGAIETGLKPDFIGGAKCPEIDSEKWAIDYSHKRPWPAIHKGIDIPQPHGTPILAVAAGTVVGKFKNKGNRKGIEVMLRHSPKQTGLQFWTYSQYTHLLEMSPLIIGQSIQIGHELGKTSNTGKMGRRIRREALHFAILYSKRPEWSNDGRFVTPKDGYWMDPNAFYRIAPPYDSNSIKMLPEEDKRVPVSYMKVDGSVVPQNTRRIWPYPCN